MGDMLIKTKLSIFGRRIVTYIYAAEDQQRTIFDLQAHQATVAKLCFFKKVFTETNGFADDFSVACEALKVFVDYRTPAAETRASGCSNEGDGRSLRYSSEVLLLALILKSFRYPSKSTLLPSIPQTLIYIITRYVI